jgi:UDP-glucose 4-epimerase
MNMSHYLITGGCGFIGSHLADLLLAKGHEVRVLDNLSTGKRENLSSLAELWVGDVADRSIVEQAMTDVDGCFHLAAVASVERCNRDWIGTHRTNLTGTITVFDCARATDSRGPIPVVYASSAAVYGDQPNVPLKETSPTQPLSAYGADKLGCELHARVATLTHGVPTVGLRFFNVYGPRQDPKSPYSGVISIFCDRLGRGQPITMFGDGEQVRDFVYVLDVTRALWAAMEAKLDKPSVFNVCTGMPTSIRMLADTIARLCGTAPNIHRAPARDGDIRISLGSPKQATERLGFTSRIVLDRGLAATIASSSSSLGPTLLSAWTPSFLQANSASHSR